jgi:hypothetical protein
MNYIQYEANMVCHLFALSATSIVNIFYMYGKICPRVFPRLHAEFLSKYKAFTGIQLFCKYNYVLEN